MNNYAEQKKTEISKIEDIIKQYCPKEEGLQKIIFEAMLEKPVLKSIAEKINEYTGAKVIFVSGTGKILAYSHTCEQDGSESIRWKHVTFSDYKKFCQEADTKEHQLVLQPVETMGRLAGYVVILYGEEESRLFFEELGSVIGQAVRHQFEDVVKETMVLQPMREAILAWSLFHGKADGIQQTEKIWTGQYIEVLMLKDLEDDEWECLTKPAKRIKEGTIVKFSDELSCKCTFVGDDGIRHYKFIYDGIFLEILDRLGEMPLPPYITEKLDDKNRYQTVYAKNPGSAAPDFGRVERLKPYFH